MGECPVDHDDVATGVQKHDPFAALGKNLCRQLELFLFLEMFQGEVDVFHQFLQNFGAQQEHLPFVADPECRVNINAVKMFPQNM